MGILAVRKVRIVTNRLFVGMCLLSTLTLTCPFLFEFLKVTKPTLNLRQDLMGQSAVVQESSHGRFERVKLQFSCVRLEQILSEPLLFSLLICVEFVFSLLFLLF